MFSQSAQCTETKTLKNPSCVLQLVFLKTRPLSCGASEAYTPCFWQHEEGHEETHEETTESLKPSAAAVGRVMNHEHLNVTIIDCSLRLIKVQ